MANDKKTVRKIIDAVKASGRTSLTAPEGKQVCDAYGIPVPKEGVASTAAAAAKLASGMGYPVVLKIVSPDILHKTEAGGVLVGVKSAAEVKAGFAKILANAKKYNRKAQILGVQVQQMVGGGQEVIIGAVTDPSFGKLVAFGLGGVLVEVMKDITFRLAPATKDDALSMLDGIAAAEMLKGVRGADPVNRTALAAVIRNVSQLVADFPEIAEMDLNPVFASKAGAIAADVRIVCDWSPPPARFRPKHDDIVRDMNRIMKPDAVAVIGASGEAGKIGNSVMKNLINGGYKGKIYPIHPSATEIMGMKAYKSVKDVPGVIDTAMTSMPSDPGDRDASSMTVASAEGPAIAGIASGTMKGSPVPPSPKTPPALGNTILNAIRNRMTPPAIDSDASDRCISARNALPPNRKTSSSA